MESIAKHLAYSTGIKNIAVKWSAKKEHPKTGKMAHVCKTTIYSHAKNGCPKGRRRNNAAYPKIMNKKVLFVAHVNPSIMRLENGVEHVWFKSLKEDVSDV